MSKFISIWGGPQVAIPLVAAAVLLSVVLASSLASSQSVSGETEFGDLEITPLLLAPMAISDDNVYAVWLSNKTGNWEVMLRVSNDNGNLFGNKVNLSNSTMFDSINPEIAASGDNVFVTWWEKNQTSNEPVMRTSKDNGNTFGSTLNLSSNEALDANSQE
jgi:hypothetical protein